MPGATVLLTDLLRHADIIPNGDRPWDIQVHDDRVYQRIMRQGTLGLGEAYMDGWWDCDAIDQMVEKALRADLKQHLSFRPAHLWLFLRSYLFNLASKARAFQVGEQHYDAGNDLYEAMLDKRLTYTCGYWHHAATLDDAQEAKLDLICKKIVLKAGDRVLDIGSGWGSFAGYAAETYGAHVTGVTVSKEQIAYATERYKDLPCEFRLEDYRDLPSHGEQYDHIVSVGMFEHVGAKNYNTFFDVARRCLKDGGLFLLHTIGGNVSAHGTDPWIEKYIFPNSMLPSISQIGNAIEKKFVMEDWHNFGPYYDKTLMVWYHNTEAAWDRLGEKYDERFRRMWRYYLLVCAGLFRAREAELWQIVLSKDGVRGGYTSFR